jgi:hypothetical protein
METAYDGRQVVGMDLHRRRSVLVRMTEDGRRLGGWGGCPRRGSPRPGCGSCGRSPSLHNPRKPSPDTAPPLPG